VPVGFASLIARFLRGDSQRRAVAFWDGQDGLGSFRRAWRSQALEFHGRIAVVTVDLASARTKLRQVAPPLAPGATVRKHDLQALQILQFRVAELPPEDQKAYVLGRIALRATCSQRVLAVGGGAPVALEAEACLVDGGAVEWSVYAPGRKFKEQAPTVVDWAARGTNRVLRLFRCGNDGYYVNAFHGNPITARCPQGHPLKDRGFQHFQAWRCNGCELPLGCRSGVSSEQAVTSSHLRCFSCTGEAGVKACDFNICHACAYDRQLAQDHHPTHLGRYHW